MSQPTPSISIITVSLNSEKTIADSLASAKRQLHPFQHVVVDGASTDGTTSVAKRFLNADDVLVSEPDRGMYDALNKGIVLSHGEIIGTLNADDFYPHNRVLSLVAEQFQDPAVDACYGDLVFVDRLNPRLIKRYWKSRQHHAGMFANGWMPPHPTFFARRRVYEDFGSFRIDFGTAADYELLLRLFVKNKITVRYIPEILVIMRVGGLSNISIKNRWQANLMDRRAWRVNNVQRRMLTPLFKPFSKSKQYIQQRIFNRPWLDADWPHDGGVPPYHIPPPLPLPRVESDQNYPCKPMENLSPDSKGLGADALPFYVVTVNYHSESDLQRLVESVASVSGIKELIVVDHSATFVENAFPQLLPMRVVREPNRGYGAGLNAGMRHIPERDGVVLLCNPDTEMLTPDETRAVLKEFRENQRLAILAPSIVNSNLQRIHSCRRFYSWGSLVSARLNYLRMHPYKYRRKHFYMDHNLNDSFEVDWASGSALFLRLRFFPFPICFDERFFLYFEDVDLCAVTQKHGLLVKYFPDMVIVHHEKRQSAASFRFLAIHAASMLKFIVKYRGLPSTEYLQSVGPMS